MAEEVSYYAIVNEMSSRAKPGGIVRRVKHDNGQHDEAFTRDLIWKRTSTLYAAERGDTQNDLIPISEEEAERIVERIRQEVTEA
jgi:hypothetical protein